MSYAGHVIAMIQTLRNNRNLLKKRDKLFTGLNKRIAKNYRHRTKQEKTMSKEQLDALRLKLIRENRLLLVKKISTLVFIVVLIIVLFIWLNNVIDLEKLNERYGF